VILEELHANFPFTRSAPRQPPARAGFYHNARGFRGSYFFLAPLLTVKLTFVLRGRLAPGRLLCEITRPFLTFALKACLILPGAHRFFLSAAFAFASVLRFTFGTLHLGVTCAGGRTGGGGWGCG
jgi:hypothetical protein